MSKKRELTADEARILRHMLGMEGNPRRVWGYRNYYAAGRDGVVLARLRGMVKSGLVREGQTSERLIYFHVTEEGCRAMGLNTEQRRRALEG